MSNRPQPSGGEFYNGSPDKIFSIEQFRDDERLMIDVAEQFSRREVLTRLPDIERQADGLMPRLIRQAGELGLCGIDAPERHGGLGLGLNLAARILEWMSLDGSFAVTYGITSGISQVGLALFGSETQKAQYLPGLTSGAQMGAYALSEPNSGSDALSATTRAERRGGDYVLNGVKMWISNAKWADLFLVMAKVDGEKFSAFLVDRDSPGLTVRPEEHKLGLKGSSTAQVRLEEVRVPQANLLYEVGLGHHVAFNALNIGRLKLAAMSMGPARHAIELASQYAQERRQFGQPIASFGLIQQKFAEMAILFYAAESVTYRTGALMEGAFQTSSGTIDDNRRAASEYAIEASIAKVFATEAEGRIVDEALQVFGGYGFTEDFPIARIYRDARVSRIYEGTNEINRLFIADRLRRRIREGHLAAEAAGDSFISSLLGRAVQTGRTDQVAAGVIADLAILTYAEQSVKARSSSNPTANLLADGFIQWAEPRAVAAIRRLSDEPVAVPAGRFVDETAIAEAVYQKRGPLS